MVNKKRIIENFKIAITFIIIISNILLSEKSLTPTIISAAEDTSQRQSLNLHVISPYNIKLEWKDNINYEKGFVIQKAVDSGSFTTIAVVGANSTSYNDFNVSPGYVYTYRIFYMDYHGSSSQYTREASTFSDMISRPDTLDLIPTSPTQIELSWTYPGYKQYDTIIERKAEIKGQWETIHRTSIGVYKYIDKELTDGIKYYYRIKAATDSNIFSAYYPSDYGKTVYTSLKAPEDVYGYAVSHTKIFLTWKYDKQVDYFEVERKTEDTEYIKIAINPFVNKWFQDSGLSVGKLYTYRIRAKEGGSLSEYSQEITINCGYINPPVALSARASSSKSIELEWENRGLDIGAEVELWRKSDIYEQWELYTVLDRNYSKFVDNNIEEGINYSYRLRSVIAYNKAYSNYSNVVNTHALNYNPISDIDYTVVGKNKIQLMWNYEDNIVKDVKNDNNGGSSNKFKTGYIIEKKEGIYGKWEELAELPLTAGNYFVTGLDEKQKYYFRVKVFSDDVGMGVYSKEIEITTCIPKTPQIILVQTLSPSKIKLNWQNDVGGNLKYELENELGNASNIALERNTEIDEGFIIERKLHGQSYYKIIATLPPESNMYIDTELSPSKRYNYRIKAFNKAGASEYTKEMFAVTSPALYFYDIPSSHPAREAINDLAGRGIVKGKKTQNYEEKIVEMFYPDEAISKSEFVCMLIRAFKPSGKVVGSFADVTYGNWFYDEIMIAKNMGIITGDKDNYFYPDRALTHDEMWDIINRMLKSEGKSLIYEDNSTMTGKNLVVTRGEAAIEISRIID